MIDIKTCFETLIMQDTEELIDQAEWLPLDELSFEPAAGSPEDDIIARIDRERLMARVMSDPQIKARQKMTLSLINQGLSQEEIGAALGMTRHGAHAKVHNSLRVLRRRVAGGLFRPAVK